MYSSYNPPKDWTPYTPQELTNKISFVERDLNNLGKKLNSLHTEFEGFKLRGVIKQAEGTYKQFVDGYTPEIQKKLDTALSEKAFTADKEQYLQDWKRYKSWLEADPLSKSCQKELYGIKVVTEAYIAEKNQAINAIEKHLATFSEIEKRVKEKLDAENSDKIKNREAKSDRLRMANASREADEKGSPISAPTSDVKEELVFHKVRDKLFFTVPGLAEGQAVEIASRLAKKFQDSTTFRQDNFIKNLILEAKKPNSIIAKLLRLKGHENANLDEAMFYVVETVSHIMEKKNHDFKAIENQFSVGLVNEIDEETHYQDFINQVPEELLKLNELDALTDLLKSLTDKNKDRKFSNAYRALSISRDTQSSVKLDTIESCLNLEEKALDVLQMPSKSIEFNRVFKTILAKAPEALQIPSKNIDFKKVFKNMLAKTPYDEIEIGKVAILYKLAFDIAMLQVKWVTRKIEKNELKPDEGNRIYLSKDKSGKVLAFKTLESNVQTKLNEFDGTNFDKIYKDICDIIKNVYAPKNPFYGLNRGWFDHAKKLFDELDVKLKSNYQGMLKNLTIQNSVKDEKSEADSTISISVGLGTTPAHTAFAASASADTAAAPNTAIKIAPTATPPAHHPTEPSRRRDAK